MAKLNILNGFKSYKNGTWSSVFVCYYLSFLPIIVSFFYTIFNMFNATHFNFLYLHLQYTYLLFLFPIAFIFIDVTRIIRGKYKLRFSFRTFSKDYPEILVLFGVIVWILISCIARIITKNSPFGFEVSGTNIFSLRQGFPFYIFYGMCFAFAFMIKSRSFAEKILLSLISCSTILVLFSLVDPTGTLSFQSLGNTYWCSVFSNSNFYGFYLSITTIICFLEFMQSDNKIIKYVCLGLGSLHLLVCFLNNSLACMLSVFIALLLATILLPIKNHKFDWQLLLPIAIFIGLSQICTLFAKSYYSNYTNFFSQFANMFAELISVIINPYDKASLSAGTGRVELWIKSIKEILAHPVLGNGNTKSLPHSEYLQLAEIWGLPCLTFYISAIIIVFIKCFKNFKRLSPITITTLFAVISYLISAFFGNIMPHIVPYFIMVLALLIRWSNVDIKRARMQKEIHTEGITITDANVM